MTRFSHNLPLKFRLAQSANGTKREDDNGEYFVTIGIVRLQLNIGALGLPVVFGLRKSKLQHWQLQLPPITIQQGGRPAFELSVYLAHKLRDAPNRTVLGPLAPH